MRQLGTICAVATPTGESAICVVRVSGDDAINIVDKIFTNFKGEHTLANAKTHTAHYGKLISDEKVIDECICTVFKAPQSYTGENSVEISLHGSPYVKQQAILALIKGGANIAGAGEFTKRAFLNGKMDLSQAEAVADLIQSHNSAAHELALKQLRGGYHNTLVELRAKLLDLASLLELELDFSEEDVKFADRSKLQKSLSDIKVKVKELVESFSLGNAFKNGIPVTIVGKPNAGKSTLLNVLLNDDRAIVSDIPGTTRDTIEETLYLNGIQFRFIDTAGIRQSENVVETEGVKRTFEAVEKSKVILYVVDVTKTTPLETKADIEVLRESVTNKDDKHIIVLCNKADLVKSSRAQMKEWDTINAIHISAKGRIGIGDIIKRMFSMVNPTDITDKVLLTNSRHYEAMIKVLESIESTEKGFESNMPSDLIATDMRSALHYIAEITGEVTTDDILGNIFSKFCVGK